MTNPQFTARRSAVFLLDQVLGEGRLMSDLVASGKLDRLDPADRARAQRLANDTLRGLDRADRLLSRQLRKPPALHVRNILRLGTVELGMGGDAHGVVNELVGLMGNDRRHAKLKGLVNAVLRKMADGAARPWHDLRLPRLPGWLREPLVAAWVYESLGQQHKVAGELERAREAMERALAFARRAGCVNKESGILTWLSQLARLGGDIDGAYALCQRALALGELDAIDAGMVTMELTPVYYARGDLEGAIQAARDCRDHYRARHDPLRRPEQLHR